MLAQHEVAMTTYDGVMANAVDVGAEGQRGFGEPVSRSAFIPTLTPEFARDAAELLRSGVVYFFELRTMGGAIADAAAETTAFAHRSPDFQVAAMSSSDALLSARWSSLSRSEERRVGKEGVSPCRSRWSQYHQKKKHKQ